MEKVELNLPPLKIVHTPPPNYDEIRAHFPLADYEKGTLFTYGDTCYAQHVTPDNQVHEATHAAQQGDDPATWWARYFVDSAFRFEQELAAFRAQWLFIERVIKDKARKRKALAEMASWLSGEFYGNLATLTEAKSLISNGQ